MLSDQVFEIDRWQEFLNSPDFLVMAIPLTDATYGICREEYMLALRPSAYVLNLA